MGHVRLKKLPKSLWWDQVVELLDDGGSVEELARATFLAMDRALAAATKDPALTQTLLLLAALPGAARQSDYVGALRDLGISAGAEPTLLDTLAGFERAVDREARRAGGRTDLGEMALLAAASSLTTVLTPELPALFGTTSRDLQAALAKLDTPDRFARLSRTFFADVMQRSLEYYLSRAYARHTGPGEMFASIGDQDAFRSGLSEHCFQTALIVEQYSAEWYSKSKFGGGFSAEAVSKFTRTSLDKLRKELNQRSRSDG